MEWMTVLKVIRTLVPLVSESLKDFLPDVPPAKLPDVVEDMMGNALGVEKLQGALNKKLSGLPQYVPVKVDGLYGPATRDAVKVAQDVLGVKVDGWAGPVTGKAMVDAGWF